MTVDPDSQEAKMIRQFMPLSRMPLSRFNEMCQDFDIEELAAGECLFKQGDAEKKFYYLVSGCVSLETEEFKVESIVSDSECAKFPLAHQIPRKIDAYAASAIKFLRVDIDMLNLEDSVDERENSPSVFIEEQDGNDDWMTMLLKSPIFRALPPANLQRIIMRLEAVVYQPGEVIINQGDKGDYYYLIKSGRCLITRKPNPAAKEIKLGILKNQDTFGEDALLSDNPRNVTIRAATEVSLLRLNKEDFIDQIRTPSLKFIDIEQAKTELTKGAILLDVRTPDEFQRSRLDQSINIPFFSLRMHLKTLDKKKSIIVVCENGQTSEAAAFLLLRHKFDAYILKGGILCAQQADMRAANVAESPAAVTAEVVPPSVTMTAEPDKGVDTNDELARLKRKLAQLEQKYAQLLTDKEVLMEKYDRLLKKLAADTDDANH